jgi:hypothetical protein
MTDVNYMKRKMRWNMNDECVRGTRRGYVVRAGRQARRTASCPDTEYHPTASKYTQRKRTWPEPRKRGGQMAI